MVEGDEGDDLVPFQDVGDFPFFIFFDHDEQEIALLAFIVRDIECKFVLGAGRHACSSECLDDPRKIPVGLGELLIVYFSLSILRQ